MLYFQTMDDMIRCRAIYKLESGFFCNRDLLNITSNRRIQVQVDEDNTERLGTHNTNSLVSPPQKDFMWHFAAHFKRHAQRPANLSPFFFFFLVSQ